MSERIAGIHHITAVAADAQRTVDFYTRLLGLRLVKRTVNFDDPGTYHLYFGDESGRPGTILTFFPWQGIPRGRHGSGISALAARGLPGEQRRSERSGDPRSAASWPRHRSEPQFSGNPERLAV